HCGPSRSSYNAGPLGDGRSSSPGVLHSLGGDMACSSMDCTVVCGVRANSSFHGGRRCRRGGRAVCLSSKPTSHDSYPFAASRTQDRSAAQSHFEMHFYWSQHLMCGASRGTKGRTAIRKSPELHWAANRDLLSVQTSRYR